MRTPNGRLIGSSRTYNRTSTFSLVHSLPKANMHSLCWNTYIIHNGSSLKIRCLVLKTHQISRLPGRSILTPRTSGPAKNRTMAARCAEFSRNASYLSKQNASRRRMGWEHWIWDVSQRPRYLQDPIRILVNSKKKWQPKRNNTKYELYCHWSAKRAFVSTIYYAP